MFMRYIVILVKPVTKSQSWLQYDRHRQQMSNVVGTELPAYAPRKIDLTDCLILFHLKIIVNTVTLMNAWPKHWTPSVW